MKNTKKGYILDGFPRTLQQAKIFDGDQDVDKAIYFKIKDSTALDRLVIRSEVEEREDDTMKAIKRRIRLFHKHTKPVLHYFRENHLLVELDGEDDVKLVTEHMLHVFHLKP